MIRGLHHVALVVPDFAKALDFYTRVLGFELLWRSALDGRSEPADQVIGLAGVAAEVAMLRAGGAHVELWQYHHPVGAAREVQPCDSGYAHIALDVTDIDAEYERLSRAGMTFHRRPVALPGSAAIYGRDPFGNLIELYQLARS